MGIDDLIAWASVVVGLLLTGGGAKASWYFWKQYHLLGRANWVLAAIFRTVVIITFACLVLTLNRAWMLTFGPEVWNLAISGTMVVTVLLIPWLLFRTFVGQEGAPLDRAETVLEQEDREVGSERRHRQSRNRSRPK